MQTVELIIKGKVQGVGFRYFAKKKADELGITGWIKNEQDGTVKAVICGNEPQISAFVDWCRKGPAHALVTQVEMRERREDCKLQEFSIII